MTVTCGSNDLSHDDGLITEIGYDFQECFRNANIQRIKLYPLNGKTGDELQSFVDGLPDLKEGFVIRDCVTGTRVKMKSRVYLVAHRMRGEFSVPRDKDLIELIRINEQDEFVAYFPEWKERVDNLISIIDDYKAIINQYINDNKHLTDKKEFAIKLNSANLGSIGTSIIFSSFNHGVSVDNSIKAMSSSKYERFVDDGKEIKENNIKKD